LKEDVNNINLNEKENPSYIPKKYLDRLHSIENTPGIRLRSALCHEKCVYKCSKCEKHLLPECFTKYRKEKIYIVWDKFEFPNF